MKCKNCGATLDEGALFCRKCGTAVPQTPEPKKTQRTNPVLPWLKQQLARGKERISGLLKNRRLLMTVGAGVALLLVLIIVITSAVSCSGEKTAFRTSDEVIDAAIDALGKGDGERLYRMTALSEKVLGAHPEVFGEGDTPEAVMKGYYARLAGDFKAQMTERYGKDFALSSLLTLEKTTRTGSEIFESNRALGIEAEDYVSASGSLSVGEDTVQLYLVAANTDGGWKLLVLYLSGYPVS